MRHRWRILGFAAAGVAAASTTILAAPGGAAPVAVVVKLAGGAQASPGNAMIYTASTSEKLSQAGGHYALELRGVDLVNDPRGSYTRPSYRGKQCLGTPCKWSLTAKTVTTYVFRAFLIDLRSGAVAGYSSQVRTVWKSVGPPAAIQLLINNRKFPIEPLEGGADAYNDIKPGAMKIRASWSNDLAGSGYYVLISTDEPRQRDYVRCTSGTSCTVPQNVSILNDQEQAWLVQVMSASTNKLVSGFKVCLIGRP